MCFDLFHAVLSRIALRLQRRGAHRRLIDACLLSHHSQRQILEMYKKGGAYNGQDIPWDVRKAQPALEQLEREGLIKGVVLDAGCGTGVLG